MPVSGRLAMFDRELLNRLFRYCRTLCAQESDAFDLLQNGVERCLRSPPEQPGAAYGYAVRVIRNLFIDQLRREQGRTYEAFDETHHSLDYDISSLEALVIESSELERIWALLSTAEREILYLWAVEGCSTTEVAALLEKPRNSVLSIIHRMRRRLIADGHAFQEKEGTA